MNHSFDIEIAEKYGVIEAVLYENFRHWLRQNYANGKNIRDGRPWTYNSVKAYAELFPYLSEKQIRRGIDSLVDQGAIIKGEYNKANYDKTSWYSVPDIAVLAIRPKGQMDSPEKANRSAQKGEPIPYINTDENNISAADFIKSPFEQEKKKAKIRKPVKTLNIPEIESLLNIMEKTGIKMSTISANLKMQMLHAVELHGLEFCESALRGRVIQAAQQGKPLYLPTLFDPENGQWLNDCANIFEAQEKKVVVLHSMTDPDIDNLMSEMQAAWKAQ